MNVKKQSDKKENTISIVLKSFDHALADAAVRSIIALATQERVKFTGPIPLPCEKRVITVNKSPHIDKTARNQYIQITSKRLISVDANVSFVEGISKLSLPYGVEVKVSLGGVK